VENLIALALPRFNIERLASEMPTASDSSVSVMFRWTSNKSRLILIFAAISSIAAAVTFASYRLGESKTENPKKAALLGFALSFLPPLALVYLVILFLKEENAIV
jgi:Na+-driven multidrug efflux pump